MNIVIFEDDIEFRKQIEHFIESYIDNQFHSFYLDLVTKNIDEVNEYLNNHYETTLFFIDIIIDGIELGIKLQRKILKKNHNNITIFLTDYPDLLFFMIDILFIKKVIL